ncbi:conjugal transfer protein TraX [Pseudomonas sp. CFBP 13711]|uniref:TraX family protein n=1 Tax=unclassified Pseudomonas TaxID=196821 RepID=UPI001784BE3D|nr:MULTISPECIES: TraX family protein [unclassified Pseudomonas]MBD8707715.1 conjugal transfer protein TraX [Pseudomonas sp. CFBP 13711]MBD8713323.1 conjugal transfer protein TraX [Pseudomonas sp. CFBP 13715]
MSEPKSMTTPGRNRALDLLKWLAMLSMVMDHLRYVGWHANWLYVPGRLAFPWFCLAIAVNVVRTGRHDVEASIKWKYLTWLAVFSVVAELPYRIYMAGEVTTLNVLPTLALGLLVAQGGLSRSWPARVLGIAALAMGVLFGSQLMFGMYGVLLPLAFVLVLRTSIWLAIVPGIVCLLSNEWPKIIDGMLWGDPISIGALVACLLAPLLGLAILRGRPAFGVWPMRRWAYLIYPVHFLLLFGVRQLIE